MPAPFPLASVLNEQVVLETLGIPIEVFLSTRARHRGSRDPEPPALRARDRSHPGRGAPAGFCSASASASAATCTTGSSSRSTPASTSSRRRDAATEPGKTQARIGTVMGELNRITADIRSTIFDLRSGARDAGFEAIVLAVADETRPTLVKLTIGSEARIGRCWPPSRPSSCGIVTEAFSNVLRHAHATTVTVRMACTRRRFTLEVRDDGAGSTIATAAAGGGDGRGPREHPTPGGALDADLTVDSAPGRGTACRLRCRSRPPAAIHDRSTERRHGTRAHPHRRRPRGGPDRPCRAARPPAGLQRGRRGPLRRGGRPPGRQERPDVVVMDIRMPGGGQMPAARSRRSARAPGGHAHELRRRRCALRGHRRRCIGLRPQARRLRGWSML